MIVTEKTIKIAPEVVDADYIMEKIHKFPSVFWFVNNWLPAGMIYNEFSGTGYITWTQPYILLGTGATLGSHVRVQKDAYGLWHDYSWGKRKYLGVLLDITTYSAQYIHIVLGDLIYNSSVNTLRHIGFKIIDDILYGTVGNGASETTLSIETLTAPVVRTLECILTPALECRFYVGGVDKGALTTNLPSGDDMAYRILHASAFNTEAADKLVYICEWRALQSIL